MDKIAIEDQLWDHIQANNKVIYGLGIMSLKSQETKCSCRSNTLQGGQSFGRVGFCGACCKVWNPFKNKEHGTYST